MGISGLLPFVKSASTEKHIKEFKGQTVAIDSYCWLHKGAFGCADKLAMGEKTDGYIHYCFKYIDMLQTFKIKPIMVFDGQHLPAKLMTEKKRRESRKQARKRATECLKLGNMIEARNNFRRCVDITPEMAFEMIKECRRRNIDCVVAPYEADAQLAYLNRAKIADFVISEDSDLLAFGCSKVLFKLDLTGKGTLVESDKLYLATKDRPDTFSFDKFRQMCVLSGCDYLESLPGIGLKKAHKFFKNVPNDNIYDNMVKLPKILNMPNVIVTKEYRDQFMIADATFQHQLVFDVIHKKVVPLTDPGKCGTNEEYLCNAGKMLDADLAYQIAVGNYNPFNHERLSDWTPQQSNFSSIWCRPGFSKVINKKIDNNILKPDIRTSIKIEKPIKLEDQDDRIEEKILMLYSVTKVEEKTELEDTEERPTKKIRLQDSPTKHLTSPILNGRKHFINPFLKKKNLLNSLKKVENEEKVVISKYFSSNSEETDEKILKTKRKSVTVNGNLEIVEKTKENLVETNSPTKMVTRNSRQSKTCETTEKTKESLEKQTKNSRKSGINEYEIEDDSNDLTKIINGSKMTFERCKIIESSVKTIENGAETIVSDKSYEIEEDLSDEELQSSLKENEKTSPNSLPSSSVANSPKKVSPNKTEMKKTVEKKTPYKTPMKCRAQGLTKNSSKNKFKASKSQPTLVAMFAQWKK